ncbi:MAG: carboxypeptidase-like regulatory domain-containing protein [Poseidonia sp.]
MDADREERMEALRARVRAKKEAALNGEPEEELVVSTADLTVQSAADEAVDEWYAMIDRDADRWRNLAAALIFIGSLLGMMSGALILQGNPTELLNTSFFAESDAVDISGTALEDVDGSGVENVSVELLDATSKALLQSTSTDAFGYFSMSNVQQELHIIVFSKEGYTTVERTFVPDNVGLDPVTMKPGNGTREENDEQSISGWTLDNAVGLSTAIGLLTIMTALLGVQAAVEIRRGKRYRRSQYLAAGALFSRGLIIVGPTLILFGMIVNLFAKHDFEDERED